MGSRIPGRSLYGSDSHGPHMALSLTDKIVGFIVRPVETFRAVREEELGPPIIYWLVLLIINAILTAIVAYLGFGAAVDRTPGVGAFIAGLIAAFILGIIALLLWAIFLHIGAKVMSGRGDFADSFKSAVYAQTPNLLLGWIPIIGIIFWLWSIVLLFLGVREIARAGHNEGRDRGRDRGGALHHRDRDPRGDPRGDRDRDPRRHRRPLVPSGLRPPDV